MPSSVSQVQKAYGKVQNAFSSDSNVSLGGKSKKGFGSSALKVKEKIFAMVSSRNAFVIKLPKTRVDELIASGKGKRFEPSDGRIMKEWIELDFAIERSWVDLAKEAKAFVSTDA